MSRYNLLGRLRQAHDATSVLPCLTGLLEGVPEQLRRTLTFDQGREMARHLELAENAGIAVFFAERHNRWQRPSNEAFNGLLLRYVARERTSPSTARPTSMRSVTASTRCPDGSITGSLPQTAIIPRSLQRPLELAVLPFEAGRFTGASYKAANWIYVGQSKGRGKLDRTNSHALAVKDIYPLHRDYREVLAASPES